MTDYIKLKDHLDFNDEVRDCIRFCRYEKLLDYTNFSLCVRNFYSMWSGVFCCADKNIIKHIFDNTSNAFLQIYFPVLIFKHKDIKLIKYFVEKYHYFDLESIHYTCRYGSFELIKYMLSLDIDFDINAPVIMYNENLTITELLMKNYNLSQQNISELSKFFQKEKIV